MLSAAEMLQNGITTFCDGYFFEESAAKAALDSGMRAILGQGILDYPAPDQPDPARAMERAIEFLEAFPRESDRIQPSLFCHSPYTCGPQTLERVKSVCRDRGILFQIHLSETASEVSTILEKTGVRPVHYLDGLGILDELTLCAHGVWLDKHEIEVLADRGAAVSHCMESNMKMASGVAPLPELMASGVTVGLGTDSCASNNNLDLFCEMGLAAKLHKVHRKDPLACPAQVMLALGTRGGASALSLAEEIGSIEVGKRADIAAIDIRQPHLTPLYSPISHLVYSTRGSDVRHVWVDGELVVSNGVATRFNMEKLMKEIDRIASKVKHRRLKGVQ
jgi:5-methylthioadenosine/S-adenosylhomocysteine deaminase